MRVRTGFGIASLVVPMVLLGSVAAGQLGRGGSGGEPVSDVIFPPQEIPLRFSHALHLARGVECVFCHQDAAGSRSSLDNLIPTEAACANCHPIERDQPTKAVKSGRAPARCDACHVGFDPAQPTAVRRVRIPTPQLKFDHRAHTSRGIACTVCHGDLLAEKVELATRDQLPTMKLCLSCHDGKRASRQCTTCHLAAGPGRLMTELPSGTLKPSGSLRGADHDLMFRTSHRAVAQNDPDFCAACHQKTFCIDCHNGVVKPMDFHGNDYVALHAIEARRNQPDCSTCHRTQTFCVGCHSRSGVAPDRGGSELAPPSSGMSGPRFHPDGWVTFEGGMLSGERSANHHSFQAQRNIRQCASCHREEFCEGCHTAEIGGLRINPHPAGWNGSRRCRALAARNGRMCLRCHTQATAISCDFMP